MAEHTSAGDTTSHIVGVAIPGYHQVRLILGCIQVSQSTTSLLELTAQIVSSHISANEISPQELPTLISGVYQALSATGQPAKQHTPDPAVSPRRSIFPDYIICLEDGQKLKTLKRHLRVRYGMTPAEYRAKWGLPKNYPVVAPNYSRQRSALAKVAKLGQKHPIDTPTNPAQAGSKEPQIIVGPTRRARGSRG